MTQPDRGKEVYHPGGQFAPVGFQDDLLLREDWRHVFEGRAVAALNLVCLHSVDQFHPHQTEITLSLFGRPDLAGYGIAIPEVETPDLRLRDIDIPGAPVGGDLPQEP